MATNFKSMKKDELIEEYEDLIDEYSQQETNLDYWTYEESSTEKSHAALRKYIESELIEDLTWYLKRHNTFTDEVENFLKIEYNARNLKALADKIFKS